MYYSADGVTWAQTTFTTSTQYGTSIAFGDGKFVIANGVWWGGGEPSQYRYRSADGVTWFTNGYWAGSGLCNYRQFWTGTQYVTVRNDGMVYVSPDGYSWTLAYTFTGTPTNLAYKNGVILIGDSLGYIHFSKDNAVSWTKTLLGGALNIAIKHVVLS